MRAVRSVVAVLLILTTTGCAQLGISRPPPPTLAEVVQMARDNVPSEEIIRKMRESGAVYRLSGSEFARLGEQGVPDAVLDYMQQTNLAQARYEEWAYLQDRSFGWPYYGFTRYPGPWPHRPSWWYSSPPPLLR